PPISSLFPYTTLFRSRLFCSDRRFRFAKSLPCVNGYSRDPVTRKIVRKFYVNRRSAIRVRFNRRRPKSKRIEIEPQVNRCFGLRSEEHTSELQSQSNL